MEHLKKFDLSDFVAEKNEEWSEKRVVFLFISLLSREREFEVWNKML